MVAGSITDLSGVARTRVYWGGTEVTSRASVIVTPPTITANIIGGSRFTYCVSESEGGTKKLQAKRQETIRSRASSKFKEPLSLFSTGNCDACAQTQTRMCFAGDVLRRRCVTWRTVISHRKVTRPKLCGARGGTVQ